MKMLKLIALAAVAGLAGWGPGCSTPGTFERASEPEWARVPVSAGVPYEKAWSCLVDVLSRKFDIEILSREDGYLRTGWLHSWTGRFKEDYRVRITAKFSPDHKTVDIKSEAESGGPGEWKAGYDTSLLERVKAEWLTGMGRIAK